MKTCYVRECGGKHYAFGLCAKHYQRMRNYGNLGDPKPTPEEAFWARVEKTDDCWYWTGGQDGHGYGTVTIGGRQQASHRVAYEWEIGPVPKGHVLDHGCHTADASCTGGRACLHRACVRPDHLEPVTRGTNTLIGRGPSAANARKTHCPQGHEYTDENTYRSGGRRTCRTCKRGRRHLRVAS